MRLNDNTTQGGVKILKTPRLLKLLFDEGEDEYGEVPDDTRPGGYNWGEDVREQQQPAEQQPEEGDHPHQD